MHVCEHRSAILPSVPSFWTRLWRHATAVAALAVVILAASPETAWAQDEDDPLDVSSAVCPSWMSSSWCSWIVDKLGITEIEPMDKGYFEDFLRNVETRLEALSERTKMPAFLALGALFLLEFLRTLTLYVLDVRRNHLFGWLGRKFLVVALIGLLISETGSGTYGMHVVEEGFRGWVAEITGEPEIDAGGVYGVGADIQWVMLIACVTQLWFLNPLTLLMWGIVYVLVQIGFIFVATVYFIVRMEVLLATHVGLVLLAFAGFSGTASIADRYLSYLFSASVRLFVMEILIRLSVPLFADVVNSGEKSLMFWYTVVGLVGVLVGLVRYLPAKMASSIAGFADFGIQRAMK